MWQAAESEKCGGCGLPAAETTAADAEGAYTAHKIVCHACAARENKANVSEQLTPGTKFYVTED